MPALFEPQFDLVGLGHRVLYGTAPPAAASDAVGITFQLGDRILNTAPFLSGIIGWLCVASGTLAAPQGTWVEMGNIQSAAVTLTAAQILAMSVTPVTLVAAQGAGTMIEVVSCVLELVYGTTQFASGGVIGVSYTNNAGPAASTTIAATFLNSPTANQIALLTPALASNLAANVLNKNLVLSNATGAFTTGDSTLMVRLKYRTHSTLA